VKCAHARAYFDFVIEAFTKLNKQLPYQNHSSDLQDLLDDIAITLMFLKHVAEGLCEAGKLRLGFIWEETIVVSPIEHSGFW